MAGAFPPLRYRNVHLDFHNSEHIPNIGARFDAAAFAAAFAAAHVDSVTLFAKCHHGWSYYPTAVGAAHPHLTRDLLGEQVQTLNASGIETPIYISVQWDERNARLHPEWRVRSATENGFDPGPFTAAWRTICLNHKAYRDELLTQSREVVRAYDPPGLFFDIVLTPDCVCEACIATMAEEGLDPQNPADRLAKDDAVNARFRNELSEALWADFPNLRIFYNCGHIHKQGPSRFVGYSHLELESLPTGGWGYDHFPSSARYAAPLGFDFLGHTGKFHTSWGEFGGFKHPHALEYECAQMAALGSKCLVGDQLHPSGAVNPDTYFSIAPAYKRIERLEPYLRGARQISQIAILAAEHFSPGGARNHASDDGAAQMLLELHQPFDVIDTSAEFGAYNLIILPDALVLDAETASRLEAYLAAGGKLLLSGQSGFDSDGKPLLPCGIARSGPAPLRFQPSYIRAGADLSGLTETPFVAYGEARLVELDGATALADIVPPYFNRSFAHFCSHQHAPDDVDAAPVGTAATIHGGVAYIAYPIFNMYHAVGQPLYRRLVESLLCRLLPDPILTTDLATTGRVSISTRGEDYVIHLLHAVPQVRGKALPAGEGRTRPIEIIEDIQPIGRVRLWLRVPPPSRVFDCSTGQAVAWTLDPDGRVAIELPSLHIHTALMLEGRV